MSKENVVQYQDPETLEFKDAVFAVPDSFDEFLGKELTLKDGSIVKVDHICANAFTPTMFEVNGRHLINMLSAYAQLHGEEVSEQDLNDFESLASISVETK